MCTYLSIHPSIYLSMLPSTHTHIHTHADAPPNDAAPAAPTAAPAKPTPAANASSATSAATVSAAPPGRWRADPAGSFTGCNYARGGGGGAWAAKGHAAAAATHGDARDEYFLAGGGAPAHAAVEAYDDGRGGVWCV